MSVVSSGTHLSPDKWTHLSPDTCRPHNNKVVEETTINVNVPSSPFTPLETTPDHRHGPHPRQVVVSDEHSLRKLPPMEVTTVRPEKSMVVKRPSPDLA